VSPQFVETMQGWSWTWRTWEGIAPDADLLQVEEELWSWMCQGCGHQAMGSREEVDRDIAQHQRKHLVEHEFELEWLRNDEAWQVRSRYDRAGWTDPLTVHDLDDPESFDHADNLARDYAARPRGR
jgi:hypothetical protein